MKSRRSELVKLFRQMVVKPSKMTWPQLIRKADQSIGVLKSDDIHSILIALSKCLKVTHQHRRNLLSVYVPRVHPVVVAPLTYRLISRVLTDPSSDPKTRAGIFGLIPRVGIDWNRHLPVNMRDECVDSFSQKFQAQWCDVNGTIPPQSLGYCCDAAVYLNLKSSEFTHVVNEAILGQKFPTLAIVQCARYLSLNEDVPRNVWRELARQAISESNSFTPQNFIQLFQSFIRAKVSSYDLLIKMGRSIVDNTHMMRLSDCRELVECVVLLVEEKRLTEFDKFAQAIQRRAVVLCVTSAPHTHSRDMLKLSRSLQKLIPNAYFLPVFSPVEVSLLEP